MRTSFGGSFELLHPCQISRCRHVEHAHRLERTAERSAQHVQRVLADAAAARAQASKTA